MLSYATCRKAASAKKINIKLVVLSFMKEKLITVVVLLMLPWELLILLCG